MSQQPKVAASAELPPLIDRELLFGNPEITGAQLSPDGRCLAFLKPWNDTINIWVKETAAPFSSARLLTAEAKRPIPGFLWSRDSRRVLYVRDTDGDENYNLYSVDPAAENAAGSEAPASRDLTGLKGIQVQLYSAPRTNPDVVYIGLNDRDPAWHDLWRISLSRGERTLIRENTERIASWFFDEAGELRLALRSTDAGGSEILRVDADAFVLVYSCTADERCAPVQFHRDNRRVYFETNRGEERDLSELVLFEPETGAEQKVESDPLNRVDFDGALFSEATGELQMTMYTDDKTRRYFRDKALEADYWWLGQQFPGREVSLGSHTHDDCVYLVNVSSDVEPGEVYLFERQTRRLTLQYRVRERIPREALSSMSSIRYPSSDGLEIPACLTVPKGPPVQGLPMVVLVHGGPWARDYWGYSGLTQFLANRGYAVLQPNFRSSTGFGKKFLNAGNGEWGAKMQDDITWGVRHVIAQGIADPARVAIMGGSYGGYATLAGLAFTPDLYRAGVDIVGPSNLVTLLDSIPPYWESFRKMMYVRMADPGTEEGREWLRERSPLNAQDRIRTPLMVVQGANDPRVSRAEAEQIVIALRDRGFPVEYLLAPDEGHGFARPVNNMAMFMAVEKFLAKHLDGRFQEGGTPEVMERLKEITVDPATVKLTPKVDPATVGVPSTVAALKAGTYRYRSVIKAGGQEIPIRLTSTLAEADGNWLSRETMETPMGDMSDAATLDRQSLTVRRREVSQGPLRIELDFDASGRASGSMAMNGEAHPVSLDAGGPVFGDGAGSWFAYAALPLAEGYSTVVRNVDVERQKPKLMNVRVAGSDVVTVPAGEFETWKVEVTSAEGGVDATTLWIGKHDRTPVRASVVVGSLGGAILTAELES